MNEQAQNNPQYLEHHPEAVADVDKAHTLALAGDVLETESAQLRADTITNLGSTAYTGGYETPESKMAKGAVEAIQRNNVTTHVIYRQHGDAYELIKSTKR